LFVHIELLGAGKKKKKNEITIVIPEKVIERLISDTLPVEITVVKKLSGTIWVQSIDKVSLGKNKIFFQHTFLERM
jgi:hypothetical protein